MRHHHIVLRAAVAAIVLGSMSIAYQGLAEEGKEYVSTAKSTTILSDDLASIEGKEAIITAVKLEPGWVGERHYHTGDVFVYVAKGSFTVDVEGEDRKTFQAGEVYHEAVNTVMRARNLSTTEPAELILFQVGDKGAPPMIRAE